MKLISFIILTILTVDTRSQKHQQEQFPFPPQFQSHPGTFAPDNSVYLPPESHTPMPYFPIKNVNNLQFQYLPPNSDRKPPSVYPPPLPPRPVMMSTTLRPRFDEEDEDNHEDDKNRKQQHSYQRSKQNITEKESRTADKRETRPVPKAMNFPQPIDRIDLKFPSQFHPQSNPSTPSPNQALASRRMIISAEHRNDNVFDQIKAGSFQGGPFIQAGGGVFLSSTTEPAVPILRLSNEMDLDGSFSYEALGADQTHYVQHSRMENTGTDKEEQVVEGSYSYVGDNGQTYTVHYIADANGFRASGDHLPVAPPIPEIIQRAVQYNLAEEAKRPPHLKSWQDDGKENEINESENKQRYAITPPRNLFTGRTPESFSYNFGQVPNPQNNLIAAASTPNPIKTNIDFTTDPTKAKANSGTISPQITFLASQGAHVPSMNAAQQTMARMFTTEKSTMPQLINYDAGIKESDQENNKGLWRWQYGLNPDNANNNNQTPNKNTISRSFGEGDEIMINFSDMSPEQYTNMIQTQLQPRTRENIQATQYIDNTMSNSNVNNYYQNENSIIRNEEQNNNINNQYEMNNAYNQILNENKETVTTPTIESSSIFTYTENIYKPADNVAESSKHIQTTKTPETHEPIYTSRSNIITQHNFIPPSQTVSESYDYADTFYEPRKINMSKTEITTRVPTMFINNMDSENSRKQDWIERNPVNNEPTPTPTATQLSVIPLSSTESNIKFTDFIVTQNSDKDGFRPIRKNITDDLYASKVDITTTESVEEMVKSNIFLKNFFTPKNNEATTNNIQINEEPKKPVYNKPEPKTEKVPKFVPLQMKPYNDLTFKKKPMDLSDILNYVNFKNHFESSKVKSKNNQLSPAYTGQKNEFRYIPTREDDEDDEEEDDTVSPRPKSYRHFNHQQQDELRGIIKNYKVLQRNNNMMNRDSEIQFKKNFNHSPSKMLHSPNLPPLGRAGPSMKSYLPPIYV